MTKGNLLSNIAKKSLILLFVFSMLFVTVFADSPYGDGSKNTKKWNEGGYGSTVYWNSASGAQQVTTGSGGGGNLGVNLLKFRQGWGSIASQFVSTQPTHSLYHDENIVPTPNPSAEYREATKSINTGGLNNDKAYMISFSTYADEDEPIDFGNIRIKINGTDYTPQGAINAGLIEPMFLIMTTGSANLNSIMSGGSSSIGNDGYYSVAAAAFITKAGSRPTQVTWYSKGEWIHMIAWEAASGSPSITPALIKYNVAFNSNGGQGTMSPLQNLEQDKEYDFPESTFTKYGYYQIGWADSSTATSPQYVPPFSKIKNLTDKDGTTVTLYAVWEPVVYNLQFDPNGGIGNPYTQNNIIYDQTTNLIPNEFTKDGYDFIGWSTSPTGSVEYADKASFTNLYSPQGALTLYAQWDAKNFNATINGDRGVASTTGSGSHKADQDFTFSGELKPGFNFVNWTGETTETEQSVTVKMPIHDATWTMNTDPIVYNISYELNEGYNDSSNPSTYTVVDEDITIKSPHKMYYNFTGWTGSNGETPTIEPVLPTGSIEDKNYVANWTPEVYDIIYDLRDGTNNPANPSSYTIEDDIITLLDPVRPGYDFFGWAEGNTIPAGSTGTQRFTAQWTPAADELIYDKNGGSGTMEASGGQQGEDIMVKENGFTRKGYEFKGWNTKSDGSGRTYQPNRSYTLTYQDPNTDILYAQWEMLHYPITYNTQGAANHPENPESYTVHDFYEIKPVSKPGYKFLGWEEGEYIFSGSTGPRTFTANLIPNKYEIHYHGNGSDAGEMPAQEVSYDQTVNLTENQFAKTGYIFIGWSTAEGSNEVVYADQEKIKNLSMEDGAVIDLYAVWQITTKDYRYTPCDGPVSFDEEVYTVPYGEEIPEFSKGDISNEDYTFEGWTDVEDEDGNIKKCPVFREIPKYTITFNYNFPGSPDDVVNVYNENTEIKIIDVPTRAGYRFLYWKGSEYQPGDDYKVTENHTFTAQWEIINYDIRYDIPADATNNESNPGSYNIEQAVSIKDPVRPGYRFLGWNEGNSIPAGSTGEKIFTAAWEIVNYKITYNTGPCENHPDNPKTYTVADTVEFSIPACTGYIVKGWDPNKLPEGTTGDKVITLVYEAEEYNINYNLNGGTNHPSNPVTYKMSSQEITLRPAERHGYDFVSWTPENTIPAGSTGDKTFAANWKPKRYTITYDLPEDASNNPENPADYTIEDEVEILEPSRPGYRFVGWKEGNSIPAGSTGPKTFTAVFEVIGYKISFDCQPGTGTMADLEVKLNEAAMLPKSKCAYTGHTFKGWEYNGKIYTDQSVVKNLTDKDGATIVFKAVYELQHYNIEYELGTGATNDPSNPASYTIEDEIKLKPASRKGYDFTAWTPTGEIKRGTSGPLKFTAGWKVIEYAIEYNLDGGTNNPGNPLRYTIESGELVLKDPTKNGCTFKGWKEGNRIPAASIGQVKFTATWDCSVPAEAPAAVNTGFGDGLVLNSLFATFASISALLIAKKKKEDE